MCPVTTTSIVAEPAPAAVTTPVFAPTVATASALEVNVSLEFSISLGAFKPL